MSDKWNRKNNIKMDEMREIEMELFFNVFVCAIGVAMVVGMWKVFVKAGKPGWTALIPVYRIYCVTEMTLGKGIYCLLFLVPCIGMLIMPPIISIKLAKFFGKGILFGIGIWCLPFIFLPMLGFGDAEFTGHSILNDYIGSGWQI